MNNIPSMIPDAEHAPYKLVGTPKEQPNHLERMWREASEELPPALSQAQVEMMGTLARSFGEEPQRDLDVFCGMVVQQMDHLMARVEEQDKLLVQLNARLVQYEEAHQREKHPSTPPPPAKHSVEAVWGDGVRRQHQAPGLE
jgi:hypothetical protein